MKEILNIKNAIDTTITRISSIIRWVSFRIVGYGVQKGIPPFHIADSITQPFKHEIILKTMTDSMSIVYGAEIIYLQ
ncbi:hypothetical protein D3C76_974180 [compost metagenome]